MSYILDALRRAESERERGQVPGLAAQSTPMAQAPVPSPRSAWLHGLGLVLALAVVGGLVWWLWPPTATPTATGHPATSTAAPAPVTPPAAAPAPVGPPAAAPALGPATAAADGPEAVAGPTPQPVAPPLPVVVSARPLPSAAVPAVPPPATADAPARSATPATPDKSIAAPAGEPRALTLAELTPQQRRDWPPLVIGGAVHSESAASRFIIVNGQLVREGEPAAPGVTVERIGRRAATLRWGDLRVELPY